jgi:predicted amidohydrolase
MLSAALQFFATPFDRERNLATAGRLARAAVAQGAQLLLLPELFNLGYVFSPRLTEAAEDDHGPTVSWLREQSAALGAHLAGTLLLRQGGHVRDTLVLAAPDGRLHTATKRHPFLWERCYFEPGAGAAVAGTSLGRVGLLVGWDSFQPAAWARLAGQVDVVLVASAAARWHRAVLNFPGAQKVYAAQLMPALLRQRDVLDGLPSAHLAACAAALGVPVVHALLAGRLVTPLPLAGYSLLCAAWRRPRYWPLARQARLASLRGTFFGGSALFDPQGATLAQVNTEEGLALAELPPARIGPPSPVPAPNLPAELRTLQSLLRPIAAGVYRRSKVA